jgi:predicted transcriptional regulator of viral defense system
MQDILMQISGHKQIFTVKDAAKIMNKTDKYASKLLSSNKYVKRIERGIYYIINGNPIDFYEIASNIVYPSYISLFSAFEYYSITDQIIKKYSVISIKRHRNIELGGNVIEFNFIKREKFFGYKRIGNIYIASPEKAFIDAIYYKNPEFSYVEESFNMAMRSKLIDVKILIEYAERMNSKALKNKIILMVKNYRDVKNDR